MDDQRHDGDLSLLSIEMTPFVTLCEFTMKAPKPKIRTEGEICNLLANLRRSFFPLTPGSFMLKSS